MPLCNCFFPSATLRKGNFGLSRTEVEKKLGIQGDEEKFFSFLKRVNQAISRYFKSFMMNDGTRLWRSMRVPAQ